jgi:tRNA A37 threonylcarbamoyltransferase TsaD
VLSAQQKADLAASFQHIAAETLVDALAAATDEFRPKSVVIAGGVAANQHLREVAARRLATAPLEQGTRLDAPQGADEQQTELYKDGTAREQPQSATPRSAKSTSGAAGSASRQAGAASFLFYPDIKLCTDNAAMIATLGYFKINAGVKPSYPYSLEPDPSLKMLASH